ncbi:MAG: GNAT family N-acetyltransferase [Adhaeribacter sp.]
MQTLILVSKIEDIRDLDAAFTIREKVFVEEQGVPTEDEYDQYEKTAHHYLATSNGVPCGAARWRQTEKGVKLERFAVLPEYRNQEVGSHLLHKVLQDVKAAHPDKEIYLHAQLPAASFYARQGFETVGDLFTECDIEHFKMILRD